MSFAVESIGRKRIEKNIQDLVVYFYYESVHEIIMILQLADKGSFIADKNMS
jgi:hypothetical protein